MRSRALLVSLLVVSSSSPALAATYVVAPGGDDKNDGINQPWATLQHAADTVKPGDTVQVKAGSYVGFDAQNGGTAQAPVTFSAEAGTMITSQNPDTPDGINIENCSYVVVEGFTVNGMPRTGIRTAVGDHITIRKNKMDMNQKWGILTGHVDDLLIEDNEASRSVEQHGIYVGNSGDRPVIRHNLVWSNSGNGIHMNGDLSQGGDGIISNAVVEGNIIYDNGASGGSGINCDGVQDSLIQNNLVYLEHASGISLYMIDGAEGAKNNTVVNNTIIEAADGRWALNIQQDSTGTKVFNNILLNLNPSHGAIDIDPLALPGLTSDFNVVTDLFTVEGGNDMDLAAWRGMTGGDASSFTADVTQLFKDVAMNDYHLPAASPAVDKGTAMNAPPDDLDGNARPFGAAVDIGAYEYCGGMCMPSMTTSSSSGAGGGGAGPGATTSAGPASGPGATSGSGGPAGAGGGSSDNPASGDSGGCGCRAAGSESSEAGLALIAMAGLIAAIRRSRRHREHRDPREPRDERE